MRTSKSQSPASRHASAMPSLVAQIGLEAIGVGTGRHLHPHQRVQKPARVASHAGTETGPPAVITPGSTWIRVTPSGASMSRMASALICIHG